MSVDGWFGRSNDVERVARAVGSARIVTLLGPTGVGKTALAEMVVERLGTRFVRVALDDARSLPQVFAALATAAGVPLAPADPAPNLGRALERAGTLVVLDGCDRVARELAPLLERWSNMKFLVTSTQALACPGEWTYEVLPLDRPDARALFLDRTARARGIELSDDDRKRVDEIVGLLDGLPLSVELTASRTGVLGIDELLQRLRDSASAVDPATRRLEETIVWTLSTLAPAEREVLAACCVFRGGLNAAAAEQVVAPDLAPEVSVVDVLETLRRASLLQRASDGRLTMLRATRALAAGLVPSSAAHESRHAAHFTARAREWLESLHTPAEREALAAMARDRDNLNAAFEWCARARDARNAATILKAFAASPWISPAEVRQRADACLALYGSEPQRAEPLSIRSRARELEGDLPGAVDDAMAAVASASASRDPELTARAKLRWAATELASGDARRAIAIVRRALPLLERRASADAGFARSLLGVALRQAGKTAAARAVHERSIELRRAHGDAKGEGVDRACLGVVFAQDGALFEARAALERALELLEPFRDEHHSAYAAAALGLVLAELGRLEEAQSRLELACERWQSIGQHRYEMLFGGYLANVLYERGELRKSEQLHDRATRALTEGGDFYRAAIFAAIRGATLSAEGRQVEAREAFALSSRLAEQSPEQSRAGTIVALHRARAALLEARGAPASPGTLAEAMRLLGTIPALDDDVRFARRALARCVESAQGGDTRRMLRVGRATRHFAIDGLRVDLTRKRSTRLVFEALLEHRQSFPGKSVSAEELIRRGWPGQHVRHESAVSRLYVAILALRNAGLRDVLWGRDGGYLLDPCIELRVEPG